CPNFKLYDKGAIWLERNHRPTLETARLCIEVTVTLIIWSVSLFVAYSAESNGWITQSSPHNGSPRSYTFL
ncbi:hypothetical protein PFISCL1PPCAC_11827, partial [Pristionchus fissidentatus]